MERIKILSAICSVWQIVGLVAIILYTTYYKADFLLVLLGIAGFAGVVKYFLPDVRLPEKAAAVIGVGIIVMACCLVMF